jgi:sigma-54 specific flagellar transcriptional regulator A
MALYPAYQSFDEYAVTPPSTRVFKLTLRPTSRGKLVGRSPKLLEVIRTIDRVAASNCTVLVTGESGTGKEMVVSALHDASPRKHAPLVTVNCGAIPEALLESELFGHAKGAFTGAHAARQGRVAAAEGGTLFLDEVGELPLALQVKLLRLLQQREYSPVGDDRTSKCDIRIVAATNRDLEADVRAGLFREDLYYRLNVIHVQLPALRERREDIELLARHFLTVHAERAGRSDLTGFAPEAKTTLIGFDWPGNVRALENAIERAVLLSTGPLIDVGDLPARLRAVERKSERAPAPLPDAGIDLRAAVEAFESNLIRQALERTGGNKNRAAQLLRVNRTTLVEMVKRKQLIG